MVSLKSLFLTILATGAAATTSAAEADDVCKLGKQTPVAALPKSFRILVQAANFTGPRLPVDKRAWLTTDSTTAVNVTLKNNRVELGRRPLGWQGKAMHAPVLFTPDQDNVLSSEAIKVCDTVTKKPVTILRYKFSTKFPNLEWYGVSSPGIYNAAEMQVAFDKNEDLDRRVNLIVDM